MNFEPTESMTMLRDAARQFADKRLKPGAQEWDEKEAIPPEIYKEGAELGFFGLTMPVEHGGQGLTALDYFIEMAKTLQSPGATG